MRRFVRRRGILNIAHRGGAGERPESTMEAFRHALDVGADLLELDVHLSADGELLICHDPDLSRITGDAVALSDLTVPEIQAMDAGFLWKRQEGPQQESAQEFPYRGKGLYLPTLEELFETFEAAQVNVDIKVEDPRAAEETARVIRAFRRQERTAVASFHHRQLRRFRRIAPEIATSASPTDVRLFLIGSRLGVARYLGDTIAYLQVPEYHGSLQLVNRRFLSQAHQAGREVHVWTVNDLDQMRRLIELGVDGIVTDFPSRLSALLDSQKEGSPP